MSELKEGWTWVENSKKWHYFQSDGRSLCGKFGLFRTMNGSLEDGSAVSDGMKCAACKRKLLRHVEK